MTTDDHRGLRELLGAYALGALPAAESGALRAHLDGCAECRAELAELAPLGETLRLADVGHLDSAPTPPADLGARISAAVAGESRLRDRRERRRSATRGLTAVAAAAALVAGGLAVGQGLAPDPERVLVAVPGPTVTVPGPTVTVTPSPGPFEPVDVDLLDPALALTSAGVVPHTWGLEVKIVGTGFAAGAVYRAVVVARDGRRLPAGEFLGVGGAPLKCNLQSALLREDVAAVEMLDAEGRAVLRTSLPA